MIAGVPIKTEAESGGNEKDQSVGGAQDQASVLDVEMPAKFVFPIVIVYLLAVCSPTEAWYKQMAGPSYYSVGRASGLLSGIRRSPYVRRAEPDPSDSDESATDSAFPEFNAQNFILKTMPVCIRDISPNLQSCELFQEIKGAFKCKADVFLTLDSADCAGD